MADGPFNLTAFALKSGTILLNRYEVQKVISVGDFSTIYCVQDRRFARSQKLCALKEMTDVNPDPEARQQNLESFEREANVLATLRHPAIPQIYDYFWEGNRGEHREGTSRPGF